jgi:hypothetical protein
MKTGVVVHHMPYAGRFNPSPYYFRNDTMKRCTAAADALYRKGFVELVGDWNRQKLVVKESA